MTDAGQAGKLDIEDRAAAGGTAEADLSASRRTICLTMLRPRPVPPALACIGGIRLGELLKNPWSELDGDSGTMVANRDADFAFELINCDRDLAIRR